MTSIILEHPIELHVIERIMKQKKTFRRLKKNLSLHLHFIHFLVL